MRNWAAVLLILFISTNGGAFQLLPGPSTPLEAKVEMYKGRPTIMINGVAETPMIYAITDSPGGRWTWEEFPQRNISNFAKQGIKIFQVSIWLQDIWTEKGKLDMELVRKQIRGVLAVRPDAAIMIRFHINAPFWWNDAHPEECTQYADGPPEKDTVFWGLQRHIKGDLDRRRLHSFASLKWIDITTTKIQEFCKLLSAMPEGNAVIAIHPADGVSHEWHYWGFIKHDPDTGPAMTAAFTKWLRRKYKTEQALRSAWNNSKASFSTITAPDTTERRFTSDGVFRDPRRERKVIDYFECQQEILADDIIHFCRTIKESWPRPVITGVFYGYFFMMFSRQATGGHLEMNRLLKSPYIDYFSAPQSYWGGARQMGGSGQSRGLIESCSLHGKLWLEEMDQSTSVGSPDPESELKTEAAATPQRINDDIAIMMRNLAHPFARGAGLWFYDFGPNQRTGWWDHPAILPVIGSMKKRFDSLLHIDYSSPADVLVVYDTKAYYQFHNSWNPISENSIDEFSASLHRSGVMFDNVYLEDIDRVDLRKYKAIIFGNTWLLTDAQARWIQGNILNSSKTVVWNYMPGYSNGNKIDIDHIQRLTGMKIKRLEHRDTPIVQLKNEAFKNREYKLRQPLSPMIAIEDDSVDPYAYLKHTQHIALAKKKTGNSTTWYSTIPLCNPHMLREILRDAGAHVYNEDDHTVFAGGGLLTLHSKQGGLISLKLKNNQTVQIQTSPNSTTILNAETGKVVR